MHSRESTRLCFRVPQSRLCSISVTLDVLWYLPVTHLAALLCTISSWSVILWVVLSPFLELLTHLGSHTVLQYSSFGRTSDLYALSLTLLELILRFLFKHPSVWFALEVTELICAFHLRSWLFLLLSIWFVAQRRGYDYEENMYAWQVHF